MAEPLPSQPITVETSQATPRAFEVMQAAMLVQRAAANRWLLRKLLDPRTRASALEEYPGAEKAIDHPLVGERTLSGILDEAHVGTEAGGLMEIALLALHALHRKLTEPEPSAQSKVVTDPWNPLDGQSEDVPLQEPNRYGADDPKLDDWFA